MVVFGVGFDYKASQKLIYRHHAAPFVGFRV